MTDNVEYDVPTLVNAYRVSSDEMMMRFFSLSKSRPSESSPQFQFEVDLNFVRGFAKNLARFFVI